MTITEATDRLIAAGSDNEKITLATIDLAIAGLPQKDQDQMHRAVFAAAVPHWFNREILARIMSVDAGEADELMHQLQVFSFVERHLPMDAWNVHERFREYLINFMFRENKPQLVALSAAAASIYEAASEPYQQIEWLYHLLIAKPKSGAVALNLLFTQWTSRWWLERMQALSGMLHEHVDHDRLDDVALAAALRIMALAEEDHQPDAETERRLRKALELNRKLKNAAEEALVLDSLGDLQVGGGLYEEALVSVAASMAISERFMEKYPQDLGWKRDLVVAYGKSGEIQRLLGRWEEALESLQKALKFAHELVQSNSQSEESHRDVAVVEGKMGELFLDGGRYDEALAAFKRSLDIVKEHVAQDPKDVLALRDLAYTYSELGRVFQAKGDRQQALKAFEEGLVISKELVTRDSANRVWQRDLSITYDNIGMIHRQQGHLTDALSAFKASLAIAEHLAGKDPDSLQFQQDLSLSRRYVSQTAAALIAEKDHRTIS